MNLTQKLLAFTLLGAEWVLWLLIFLSVISLAIAIERGLYYFSLRADFAQLADDLRKLLWTIASWSRASGPTPKRAWKRKSRGPVWPKQSAGPTRRKRRCWVPRHASSCGSNETWPSLARWAQTLRLSGCLVRCSASSRRSVTWRQPVGRHRHRHGRYLGSAGRDGSGTLVAIPAVVFFNFYNRRVRAITSHIDAVHQVILAALRAESTHHSEAEPKAKAAEAK